MRKNYFLSLFLLMIAFWHVEAADGSKSTNSSRNSANTMLFAPPTAPTTLVGTPVGGSSTKIYLTWADNSADESEFQIAYSTNPTGYTMTLTGAPNSGPIAPFELTGLQPGTTYYIWVRAIRNTVDVAPTCTPQTNMPADLAPTGKSVSCWSNGIPVTTNVALPALVQNVFVGTPYSQRTNTVYFEDNSTNETGFVIERSSGGDYATIATIGAVAGTGRRSYVDNTTQPNTSYSYRVHAFNGGGHAYPEAVGAFFMTPPDPPVAPNSLGSFDVGLYSTGVYWRNAANNAEYFILEISTDNSNYTEAGRVSANDELGIVVPNLNEGQTYFFRVFAVNSGGKSVPSGVYPITTLKRVAPNPAFNLEAKTISTTQIDLTWNLGTQDGITNNRFAQGIYRSSVSATDGFFQIATLGDYESSYSDMTGSPKTKYWYKIVTVNAQGQESPFSNVASATTLGPPFAPSDLGVSLANDALGNTIIKATWKDNSDDEWGFALERSTDATFASGVLRADLDSNTVAATSIPIEEGVTYYYRISASNVYGTSKYSNTAMVDVIVTAVPNAPYDLKGTATASSVSLQWGDDSNKEATFEIERSTDSTTFTQIGTTARGVVMFVDSSVQEKTKYFYRVRATNIKGSSDYTNTIIITTPAKVSAALNLATEDVFQVYPNPTADGVKVSVSENMLKESGMIIITDKLNRVVSKTLVTPNQSEYRLDLSNYSEGTYTISLRTATQQITKRVYKF